MVDAADHHFISGFWIALVSWGAFGGALPFIYTLF
jgi:hypothetical protein